MAHKAQHRQLRRVSRVYDTTIQPWQREKYNMIDLIEFEHYSYESIERDHQSENLQSMA